MLYICTYFRSVCRDFFSLWHSTYCLLIGVKHSHQVWFQAVTNTPWKTQQYNSLMFFWFDLVIFAVLLQCGVMPTSKCEATTVGKLECRRRQRISNLHQNGIIKYIHFISSRQMVGRCDHSWLTSILDRLIMFTLLTNKTNASKVRNSSVAVHSEEITNLIWSKMS